MSAQILDGKALAAEIRTEVKAQVEVLAQKGVHTALAVVLVGDFNVEYTHPALSPVTDSMKNARKVAAITDSSATYHGWGKASEVIDHIFYTGFRSCTRFETVTAPYAERKFISDHYPVEAVLVF